MASPIPQSDPGTLILPIDHDPDEAMLCSLLARVNTESRPSIIVLDCSALDYLSSYGLATLLRFRKSVAEATAHARFVVRGGPMSLQASLASCGMTGIFEFAESTDAA